jgi:TonB family protein
MPLREKFGKLVLLEETEAGPLGREYRAARLGPAGLDRLVTVLRFGPEVSSHADATRRLVDEARLAARLQNPGLLRVLGIGRVEQSFYVSSELVEGRSIAAILDRCRGEAFPFAAEHALMMSSRAAAALEFLHGKRDDAGSPLFHGLLAPSRLVVAFDGEVKLKGLGLWPALRETGLLPADERRYLAPEQAAGGPGDARSDVYALGLVLLEALAGELPAADDPLVGLGAARITSTTGEQAPLPKPLAELLRRALAPEPPSRFPGMAEMRRAVDALLFSGDFTPTTFDVAFFMHTLFRNDMEREARALEEARRGDYRDFLAEEKPAPAAPLAEAAPPAVSEPPVSAAPPGPDASASRPRSPRDAAREAASRMTLGQGPPAPSPRRRGLWLAVGVVGAVVVGGGAGWLYSLLRTGVPAGPPPAAVAAADAAAQARVRELEARVAQLEREKQEAETRAADQARLDLEAQARAGGRVVDPAAIERAQAEARRRARAEEDARQQEELRRIEDEKKAEEARLAEATPSPAPTPTPSPSPEAATASAVEPAAPAGADAGAGSAPAADVAPAPAAPPTPVPRGSLVDPGDPALTPPVLVREVKAVFPDIARVARATGIVEVRALVDENGNVTDVALVRSSRPGVQFEVEADRAVRRFKYRPGTREGVPVKTWVRVRVRFGAAE